MNPAEQTLLSKAAELGFTILLLVVVIFFLYKLVIFLWGRLEEMIEEKDRIRLSHIDALNKDVDELKVRSTKCEQDRDILRQRMMEIEIRIGMAEDSPIKTAFSSLVSGAKKRKENKQDLGETHETQ